MLFSLDFYRRRRYNDPSANWFVRSGNHPHNVKIGPYKGFQRLYAELRRAEKNDFKLIVCHISGA